MTALKMAVDILLWTSWVVAATLGDLRMLALTCLTAVVVVVARHDWVQGRRPFDKIR